MSLLDRETKFYGIVLLILFIVIFGKTCIYYTTGDTVEITVTDKEVVMNQNSSKYLIYTEVNGKTEIFENSDLTFAGKFDSSDLNAEIEVDSTYTVKCYGWRWKLFSSYRNIVKIIK